MNMVCFSVSFPSLNVVIQASIVLRDAYVHKRWNVLNSWRPQTTCPMTFTEITWESWTLTRQSNKDSTRTMATRCFYRNDSQTYRCPVGWWQCVSQSELMQNIRRSSCNFSNYTNAAMKQTYFFTQDPLCDGWEPASQMPFACAIYHAATKKCLFSRTTQDMSNTTTGQIYSNLSEQKQPVSFLFSRTTQDMSNTTPRQIYSNLQQSVLVHIFPILLSSFCAVTISGMIRL